jgi:predicted RNA binding protein YcfA (HicA-like mRNA interferase family)
MSNLPILTPKDIVRLLVEKGFVLDRINGSHHIYYHSALRKRIVVPFHVKDLPKGTMLSILKQAGIQKTEL